MFWDSVHSAMHVMTNWDTYIVVLGYLVLMLAPIVLLFLILHKKHALSTRNFRKLFLPAIEAIAIAGAVLTLFPVMLGMGEKALWGFPIKVMKLFPGGFLGLLGILIILSYLIDIIPKFRRLQSMKTFVLGGVSLVFVQIALNVLNPIVDVELSYFVPGFWFAFGIILTAGIISNLGHFVFVSLARVLGNKFKIREEVAELLILPLITTMGFLPLFIYGAWLS